MTTESLSKIVEHSLNSVDLEKLKLVKDGATKDLILAILKLIHKDYQSSAESALQMIVDYREGEFLRTGGRVPVSRIIGVSNNQ